MSALQTLIEMGFPENKAKKALAATDNSGVEQAMEWLLAHADDPSLEDQAPMDTQNKEPETEGDGNRKDSPVNEENPECSEKAADDSSDSQKAEAKSLKCDECGKLFQSSAEVEFHALKSGHSSFSESTEEKKHMTDEEKKQKLKDLEEKIRQRRKEREEKEKAEAREREKKRIQMSRDIAEVKRRYKEEEMKRLADQRRKEKLEDKIARQKVREQIERDKEARKEMFGGGVGGSKSVAPQNTPAVASVEPQAAAAPKKEYDTTRLQIRLPSGSPLVQEFKAKESLSAVRLWVMLNRTDDIASDAPFTLSTTFPRKVFSDEDMDKPLSALGLVPSAVLVVTQQ